MTSYEIFTTVRLKAINLLSGTKPSFEGNITTVCGVQPLKTETIDLIREVVIRVQNRKASQT